MPIDRCMDKADVVYVLLSHKTDEIMTSAAT